MGAHPSVTPIDDAALAVRTRYTALTPGHAHGEAVAATRAYCPI